MSDTDRPVEADLDQDEQAEQLVETDNGPTVADETDLLETEFGAADMTGTYVAVAGGDLA
ncbi:hypothetical protein ABT390_36515 [Streptomyces aurantiacus]|uniref:Uncharacterized protein n=1 Tax=Streptomyces aurantiacus JA 4570 TaxID=1286094 RepID=S3ZR13_9ACTN|nr:hypothetical protein [Streptomyces aurantiacus]EPH40840.1 hypothetical protein STRAU_6055 [Streptomyces aurantiacus JA 4570]